MKRLVLFFCLSVFALLVVGWKLFLTPSPSLAQAPSAGGPLIGTHLGEGDPNFQIEIMKMLKDKGAEPGFPVTIQVYPDSSPADLQALGRTVQETGFFAIVRVDRTCEAPVDLKLFDTIKAAFGPNAVIEYGNEVNNRTAECKNPGLANPYTQYRDNLTAIRNGSPVSPMIGPSVIDFYNSIDIAANFFKVVPESLYYDTTAFTFANSYGCMGVSTEACDPVTSTSQDIAYAPLKAKGKPFYITEFSLGPTANENLEKVVTFIETHGPKTGALKITPLIFNVCNDEGVWLIYLHGDIYTNQGTKIDPKTCDGKKDPYYLYPIKTISENKSPDMIRAELTLQGYEAYCTVPRIEGYVKDTFEEKDFAINPGLLGQLFKIFPRYDYDYSEVLVPLWRNMNIPVLEIDNKESLEGYYGHRNLSETDPFKKQLASGPVYRLTTLEEQCRLQVDILEAIEKKCSALEDPTSCALNINIPGTDYKARNLYQLYAKSNLSCRDIAIKPTNEWQTPLSSQERETLSVGLSNTPLYMPEAYRLAFLIIFAEVKRTPEPNIFNFLSNIFDVSDLSYPHDARVIAFKIPDVATNKHDIEVNFSQLTDLTPGEQQELQNMIGKVDESSYQDPLQLTANAILGIAEQKKREDNWLKQKIRDLTKDSFVYNQKSAHLIKCSTEYCQQNAVRALIDFANVNLLYRPEEQALCDTPTIDMLPEDDKPAEEADDINDEGGLLYDGPPNSLENATNDQGISQKPEESSNASGSAVEAKGAPPFEFMAEYWLNGDRKGRFSPFRGVLVYPQGYELTTIEDALAGYTYTTREIEKLRNDPNWQNEQGLKRYFELSSTKQDFPEEAFEVFVGYDPECMARVRAGQQGASPGGDETGEEEDTLSTSRGPLDFSQCEINRKVYAFPEKPGIMDQEPRILGGILGFLTRKFQETLHQVGTPAQRWLAGCKDTEEFLLGKCEAIEDDDDDSEISCTDSTRVHDRQIEVQDAHISEGVIQLAIEVSKRTCTPVEVLVGVLAKETKGMNYHGAEANPTETVVTGDPNESICRTFSCLTKSGGGSGPFSFTQANFDAHRTFGTIAPLYNDCINGLSVTLSDGEKTLTEAPDARIMGHSMCVFSANFWRYMVLEKEDTRLSEYPACEDANKRSYQLSEIAQADLDYFLGIHAAPGACYDPSNEFYGFCNDAVRLFNIAIDEYTGVVQGVVNACRE